MLKISRVRLAVILAIVIENVKIGPLILLFKNFTKFVVLNQILSIVELVLDEIRRRDFISF